MKNILLVSPQYNNGGITSWTKKFLADFPRTEYNILPIASDPKREPGKINIIKRISTGASSTLRVMRKIRRTMDENKIDILHKTTSGSIGALADWVIGRYCRKRGVKNIMHCRYGNIPEILERNNIVGWLTKRSMNQFDQIWVLDKRTYHYLSGRNDIKAKIKLTPNCIAVERDFCISPKQYTDVGFIGNLYATKGILELIEAVKLAPQEIKLHIVGSGDTATQQLIKERAGDLLGSRIKCYGRLPNHEAVEFLKKMDILALPTYYPFEAFPISILEAMSFGKLVISTRRAAIGDMLTTDSGNNCGLFVEEKSISDIVNSLNWAYTHKADADILCNMAYHKVYEYYRTEVVYKIYSDYYSSLF